MGRRVFISYKFNDSKAVEHKFRDKIIEMLKGDGNIYNGEDGFSEDLSDRTSSTIKKYLADMLFNTTVTIVLISRNVSKSEWVDWEISYSLQVEDRKQGKSRTNGVLCVILPDQFGKYDYVLSRSSCDSLYHNSDILPSMINKNRYNVSDDSDFSWINECRNRVYSHHYGSYCSIYTYGDFVQNYEEYIEIAYEKSKSLRKEYDLKAQLNQ